METKVTNANDGSSELDGSIPRLTWEELADIADEVCYWWKQTKFGGDELLKVFLRELLQQRFQQNCHLWMELITYYVPKELSNVMWEAHDELGIQFCWHMCKLQTEERKKEVIKERCKKRKEQCKKIIKWTF